MSSPAVQHFMDSVTPARLTFGERLKKLLAEREMTYRDLAQAAAAAGHELSGETARHIAAGRRQPTQPTVDAIAAGLGIKPQALLAGDEPYRGKIVQGRPRHEPAPVDGATPLTERLATLRVQKGLSQERLALNAGLDTNTVRFAENGRNRPGRETLEALARALKVDPREFPEYRLLLTRQSLDEAIVGLTSALATLAAVEQGLARAASARAGRRPILPSERSTYQGKAEPRTPPAVSRRARGRRAPG